MATIQPIVPCLWFDHQAEEAAQYYVSVFPDSEIHEVVRYPAESRREEGMVLTVAFTANGSRFLALNGGPQFTFCEAVSFQVFCPDQATIDHYWETLGAGGEYSMCGWLKDRYGLSWQIVPEDTGALLGGDGTPESQARVNAALMKMTKIDIDELIRAR